MRRRKLAILLALLFLLPLPAAAKDLVVAEEVVVDASPEEAWSLIIDFNRYPEWCPAAEEAKVISGAPDKPGSRLILKPVIQGKKAPRMRMTVVRADKPSVFELKSKSRGMNLIFGFKVEPLGEGKTRVVSYETIYEPGATAFRLIYGKDALRKNHRLWADSVKKALEEKKQEESQR